MNLGQTAALVLAGASVWMAGAWWVQRRRGEADVVDFAWAAGLGAAAVVHAALLGAGLPARRWLVAGVAAAWSARLSSHLLRRVLAPGEDGRYAALRDRWGTDAQPLLLAFFLAQGITVAALSLHFALAMLHPAPALRVLDAVGAALALGATGGEWLADRQLAAFKTDPASAGRACRAGLWRYSRHPNYFFEWLYWLAYPVIGWGAPWWPWLLVAPVAMYGLLRHGTGVPTAEAQAMRTRAQDYARYREETPVFFPWIPRSVGGRGGSGAGAG